MEDPGRAEGPADPVGEAMGTPSAGAHCQGPSVPAADDWSPVREPPIAGAGSGPWETYLLAEEMRKMAAMAARTRDAPPAASSDDDFEHIDRFQYVEPAADEGRCDVCRFTFKQNYLWKVTRGLMCPPCLMTQTVRDNEPATSSRAPSVVSEAGTDAWTLCSEDAERGSPSPELCVQLAAGWR